MGRNKNKHKLPVNPKMTANVVEGQVLPSATQQISYQMPPMSVIHTSEYNTLIRENKEMRKKIFDLEGREMKLVSDIQSKNSEIEFLRSENEQLKHKIKELEDKIQLQDVKIQGQEVTIQKLSEKVEELREEMREHTVNIEFDKLVNAIQDINHKDSLEKVMEEPFKNEIIQLRSDRNGVCHYILENTDSESIINYKKKSLILRLKNLTPDLCALFEEYYVTGFVDNLIKVIKYSDLVTPSIKEMNRVDRWWKR